MRITRHIALFILATLVGVGCGDTSGPNVPVGNQITMTRMADVPMRGGDVTSVAFVDETTLAAVINGRVYSVPTAGGVPVLMHSDADYVSVVAGPFGEIYAQTTNDLRVISRLGGTVTISPVKLTDPNIEKTHLVLSPSGEPYMLVYSYPNTVEIWRSEDRGATWHTMNLPLGYSFPGGITWGYGGEIMLSSSVGFYTSTTRGSKWTFHAAPVPNVPSDVFCADNGNIYAYRSGSAGLMVSRDGGVSFQELQPPSRAPYFVEILEGADKALYAIANRSLAGPNTVARPMSLLRSTDGGATWEHSFYTQAYDLAIRGNMIAVGQGASSSGVCISRDLGVTWTSSGLSKVTRIDDIGFDKDGNILVLAQRALFRRAGTVWQALGSQAGFARMTTAPLGRMYVGQGTTMYSSFDHGVTWSEHTVTDYVSPGLGTVVQPAVIGLLSGEFLISVTTYRDDILPQTHTAGALYRMSDDGIPRRLTSASGNFVTLLESADGDIYSTIVNFNDALVSNDRGSSWHHVAKPNLALAVNSSNKFIALGENNTFRLGTIGDEGTTEIALLNFTSQSNLITSMKFDANDRLFVVTSDRGIFYSETPLK